MRVTIRKKDLDITPSLAQYIEAKIVKPLDRLLRGMESGELPVLDLEFGRTTRHHRKGKVYHAAANLTLGKKVLRSEVDDEDIRAACDLLEEEIKREVRAFKGKMTAIARREDRRVKKDLKLDPAARLHRKGRIRNEGN